MWRTSTYRRTAAVALAAYLLLLPSFVGENVRGGIEGGRAVGSESRGRTVITYYVGGQRVIYAAAPEKGGLLFTIGVAAGGLAIAGWLVAIVRRRVSQFESPGNYVGAAFVGLLLGFVTGMPLAVVMKEMDDLVFLVGTAAVVPLLFVVLYFAMQKMFESEA